MSTMSAALSLHPGLIYLTLTVYYEHDAVCDIISVHFTRTIIMFILLSQVIVHVYEIVFFYYFSHNNTRMMHVKQ